MGLTFPSPSTNISKIHKQKVLPAFLALPEIKEMFAYLIIIYGNHSQYSFFAPLRATKQLRDVPTNTEYTIEASVGALIPLGSLKLSHLKKKKENIRICGKD